MKIFPKTIEIKTKGVFDFTRIDGEVQKAVKESGVSNGFVLLRSLHTTAALVCTEPDESIHHDARRVFERLLSDLDYEYTYEGRTNARAHQITLLFGQTHWLMIKNGKIVLGTWQGVFLLELFEPRSRRIEVLVVGDPT